jgi:hypothetical protein
VYTVMEQIGTLVVELFRAPTHEAALDRLDEECRSRFHQLAANGEGGGGIRYRFEIHDPAGTMVSSLSTGPRLDGPSLREIHEMVCRDAPGRFFE